MSDFIVSARKYRPVTFETVVGQEHITNTLKNAIKSEHLGQSFLFCGPRGVGKTTCARILAKTINCTNLSPATEACDKCDSCTSFNKGSSMNIYELDAASNNSVEDIRSLTEQVRYPPQGGKYKIYIIDEVHMLSAQAFNAFLKTLEEPPSYAIFILATTEKHKIIPTILSRCQIFDFKRIKVPDIAGHLASIAKKESINAEEEALHLIARKADGALRDALSIFDQIVSFSGSDITYAKTLDNLNVLDLDYYFQITDQILQQQQSDLLLTFNEIIDKGFDARRFINGLSSHFRDLLMVRDVKTATLIESTEAIKQKYAEQSTATSPSFLLSALSIIDDCDISFRFSINQLLHVELCLLKLCHLPSALNMSVNALEDVQISPKKKSEPEVIAAEPLSTPKKEEIKEEVQANYQEDLAEKEVISEVQEEEERETEEESPEPEKIEEISAETEVLPEAPKAPEPVTPPVIAEKPAEVEKVEKPVSESATLRIPSMSDLGVEEEEEEIDESLLPKDAFELQQVKDALKEYTKKLLEEGKHVLIGYLHNAIIEMPTDNEIQFIVENKLMEESIKDMNQDFIPYLKDKINNYHFEISYVINISEEAKEGRPYTPKEKFDFLAKKNPSIQSLKDQLGLEPDF